MAQRLLADGNLVAFDQLLRRQRRAEVPIVIAHQVERGIAKILGMPPIAWLATPPRCQACGAVLGISLQQAMNLTSTEVQQFGRLHDAEAAIADLLDSFKAVQLFLRQSDETRHDGSKLKPSTFLSSFELTRAPAVKVGTVASLNCSSVASLYSCYTSPVA